MNTLIVPLSGDIELCNTATDGEVRDLLEQYSQGTFICLAFEVDGEPGGKVAYLVNPYEDPNERARRVLADLTGVHLVFTGTTAFIDLDAALVDAVVRDLE